MLNQQTLEKLHALHLTGMAEAYGRQMEDTGIGSLSFEEPFGLLVDQHWSWRENQAMARRLKKSKLAAEPLCGGYRLSSSTRLGPAGNPQPERVADR
jgi:hypothetical protein